MSICNKKMTLITEKKELLSRAEQLIRRLRISTTNEIYIKREKRKEKRKK